jgi:predicted transcriptional regulator
LSDSQIIELTADIVSAHVANNNVATAELPDLIRSVFSALSKTSEPLVETAARAEPAVSIRSSVKPDYIVCLEDGAKLKMLKRYLRTNFNMTPEDYRAKWELPRDYPMVAPNYAEQRRSLAHKIGLGRKKVPVEAAVATKPKRVAKPRAAKVVATSEA